MEVNEWLGVANPIVNGTSHPPFGLYLPILIHWSLPSIRINPISVKIHITIYIYITQKYLVVEMLTNVEVTLIKTDCTTGHGI